MYRTCSKCGKIHDTRYKCKVNNIIKQDTDESKLRSTNRWTKKSLDIRTKANYLCEVCRYQGVLTYDNLEVHHIEKLKDNKDRLLDDYNLICLCVEHHKLADSGQLSSDFLKELAKEREERNTPYPF